MTKCVVEGCGEEYDVTCSFSFYNVNTTSDTDSLRQEWIDGALQEDSECLWRHVSLQLCAYHFEDDQQGLWIESPVLPELLTAHTEPDLTKYEAGATSAAPSAPAKDSYQDSYKSFLFKQDVIKLEHNYSAGVPRCPAGEEGASRLNVRHLVDALGYLTLKNLQRKQLWVVNVEGGGAEASVTSTEQVITKMSDSKQIIEIIPPTAVEASELVSAEVLEIMEETTIPDNFIYEIAEEQEVSPEDVKEIPYVKPNRDWTVNILPESSRTKYAFIKHCTSGKKRKHFVQQTNEMSFHDNVYILPDADPTVGIEITTSYEPENFVVDPYEHLVLQQDTTEQHELEPWEIETPRRRRKKAAGSPTKRAKRTEEQVWQYKEEHVTLQTLEEEEADKRANNRVRRKNKKYVGYDFVT